jgi:hypothetical protein
MRKVGTRRAWGGSGEGGDEREHGWELCADGWMGCVDGWMGCGRAGGTKAGAVAL